MSAPEISLLMPVHQGEATLPAALRCALGQATRRSYELVVVDDGSRDRSRALAEEAAARDPRVRVLARPHGGEAAALNTGWRAARGRYVGIVEADVELFPDWLERCAVVLDREPG
ncbi:MAG: glycosyltransferase family 2 protein, partial [Planctomycetota bacterium]